LPVERGGEAMQDGGGPAMRDGGDAEHAALETGAVTDAAFAVTRGLGYLAIALAVGGAVFLFVVWLPALAHVAGGGSAWLDASERFARIVRGIVVGAVLLPGAKAPQVVTEDVVKEMRKVNWPKRKELVDNTFVVIVASVIIALSIFVIDQAFSTVLEFVYR
jgi:preprotein translocase subunit SecE